MKTLIVGGNGHVGQALSKQLIKLGHSVSLFGSRDNRLTFTDRVSRADVVFMTIPTCDTGEIALGYHLEALVAGKSMITCEKGALAYHYGKLKLYLDLGKIGYTATVGGGSGILSLFLFPHLHLKQIVGVVNGTLNFLFSECARGKDPYQVLAHASRLGLCEPGQSSLAGVVNGEIQDMVLKLVNLVNFSGVSSQVLHASEFGSLYLSESEILNQLTDH
jgi:homoserine dehydrogenase